MVEQAVTGCIQYASVNEENSRALRIVEDQKATPIQYTCTNEHLHARTFSAKIASDILYSIFILRLFKVNNNYV